MSTNPTPPAASGEPADTLVQRALRMIADLSEGRREWLMSIPARPDHDPDLVIAAALDALKKENDTLTARVREVEGENAQLRAQLAAATERAASDNARLDWLHAKGENWIARESTTNRGFRVHQSESERASNIRSAIDAAIVAETAALAAASGDTATTEG